MKYFLKLNAIAFLYGFVLFIQTELMGNVSRLSRITHWFNNTLVATLILIIFIASTIVFFIITTRHFSTGKLRYLVAVFWIPYYIILVLLFSYLMPMSKQDEPPAVLGLILIATFIMYPFFIVLINAICTKTKEPNGLLL